MTIVIDASLALKWVLDEPSQSDAYALQTEVLIAPSFWFVEAANALWRNVLQGSLTADEAQARLAKLGSSPVAAISAEGLMAMALALAADLRHPVYDCLYLALALRERTYVVTADKRFHRAALAAGHGEHLRLLGAV